MIYIFRLGFLCLFELLRLVLPLLPGRSRVLGVESHVLMDFHSVLETKIGILKCVKSLIYLCLGWPEHGSIVVEPPSWHVGVVTVIGE